MRISTIALIIYFGVTLFWKLYAKTDISIYERDTVNYWINTYWFYSSIFYCILFYELSAQFFIKLYKFIWLMGSIYWAIMSILHLYLFFNITLYASFVQSANKVTVGACFLLMVLIYSTYKAFKNDTNNER